MLHVGFKIAAKKGDRYLNALKKHEAVIAKNVTENLFERHMKPLLLGHESDPVLMPFIHEDFLLSTKTARKLYHQYAEAEPIFDYHCHLSPRDIAANRQFKNLFEIWLEGDHYKWRAMRTNGVAERFCTGNASPFDKFKAWAATVPHTLRNPLYHWTHLELKRYFGITDLLDEKTADKIWKKANEKLATPELTTQGILKKFKVKVVCTTDDPVDNLEHHRAFAAQGHPTKMLPAFRPDKALTVNQPASFNQWVEQLAAASNVDINGFSAFLTALRKAPRLFPFARLPAVRSRPEPLLCGFLFRENCRRHFRQGAARRSGFTAGTRTVRLVHDAVFRPARRRNAAGRSSFTSARCATPTRACSNSSARTPASIPSAISRNARRSRPISTGWTRKMRCRKPSFTT